MHRLKDEDSWLGERGIKKREDLTKRIEEKVLATETEKIKAEHDRLELERTNTDITRVGIFDPEEKIVEANRRRKEEMEQPEDEKNLDPRVGVFYRGREKSESSWFGWLNWKTGEKKQVEAIREKATQEAKPV